MRSTGGSRTFRVKYGAGHAQSGAQQGSAAELNTRIDEASNSLIDNVFPTKTARNCTNRTITPIWDAFLGETICPWTPAAFNPLAMAEASHVRGSLSPERARPGAKPAQ